MPTFTEKNMIRIAAGLTIIAAISSLLASLALHLIMQFWLHAFNATIANYFSVIFPLLSLLVLLAAGVSLLLLGASNTTRPKLRITAILILIYSLMMAAHFLNGIISWGNPITENPNAITFMILNGVLLAGHLAISVWAASLLLPEKQSCVLVRILAWIVVVLAIFRLLASIYGSFLYWGEALHWGDAELSPGIRIVMALDLLQIPCGIIAILAQIAWVYIFYPREKETKTPKEANDPMPSIIDFPLNRTEHTNQNESQNNQ